MPLSSVTADCSADYATTASYAAVTGCSMSLGAGTWFVLAQIYEVCNGVANNIYFKLVNVTDSIDYVSGIYTTFNGTSHTTQIYALITLSGTKTIELHALHTGVGANFTVRQFLDTSVQASHITAIDVSSIDTAVGNCSADVSMTGAYQNITGCAVTLAPGKWLIFAQLQVFAPVSACTVYYKIYDMGDFVGGFMSIDSGFSIMTACNGIVEVLTQRTVRLAAKSDGGSVVKQFGDHVSIQGTCLIAVRIAESAAQPGPGDLTDDEEAMPYVHIRDEQAQGTQGGTFTAGSWVTRVLNTEAADADGVASLSSNQITLSAGTYRVAARAPAWSVNHHQLRLRNVTDSTTLVVGQTAYSNGGAESIAHLNGVFTIGAGKAIELQHQCASTKATDGLGIGINLTIEVFAEIEFWKLA